MANFDSFCQKNLKSNQTKIKFLVSGSARSVTVCSNFRVGISRIHILNGLFSYLFQGCSHLTGQGGLGPPIFWDFIK